MRFNIAEAVLIPNDIRFVGFSFRCCIHKNQSFSMMSLGADFTYFLPGERLRTGVSSENLYSPN